jgi:hypothetical protein
LKPVGPRKKDSDDFGAVLRTRNKGRKVTLQLPGVALPLPDESRGDSGGSQADLPEVRSCAPSAPVQAEAAGPLDAWSVDRVERASLPRSAALAPAFAASPGSGAEVESFCDGRDSLGQPLDRSVESEGDAFALASRSSRSTPSLDLGSEMSERFALGDFTGALRAAELLLGQDADHELARHYASESRQKLEGLYLSRLSALGNTPRLALPESEIRWLGLDSRMGFLISRIDGDSDYETLLELSGMPRLEALRTLVELIDAKVVQIV